MIPGGGPVQTTPAGGVSVTGIADEEPRVFPPADLAMLADLGEAFAPGGGVRRARLAAIGMEAALDPAQVAQLRLVLRILRSRLAMFVLAGRPTPFGRLGAERRERFMLRWSTSRIALWRSGFAGYRRLLTFIAYADLGPDGVNDRLVAMGYGRDERPIGAEPTPVRPTWVPARPGGSGADDRAMATLDADVVIVGSGAGGGVIAAELARSGKSTVILDAGPFVDETTMPSDELAAFDRLYLNRGLTATWDGSIPMLAGTAVGGGTVINWMTSVPAPEDVREEWARDYGLIDAVGPTWAADLEVVSRELGLSPATVVPPKDAVLLRGASALDWSAGPVLRNADDCGACGSCPFGCTRGTKRSGLRAHLATAFEHGARIIPEAFVERVVIDGGNVTGVEAALGPSHFTRRLRVSARQVVVAAGALRTPGILERSGIGHPAVGRNLRVHPVPVIAARFDDRIDMWLGTMQAARVDEFSATEPGRRGYVIESAPGHPGLIALALPWEGASEHAALMRDARHLAGLIAVTRDSVGGRVRSTRSGRVRIDYRLDAVGIATLRHALVRMAYLARAAGARELFAGATPPPWYHGESGAAWTRFEERLATLDFGPNRATVFSAHQMGTARMGADASTAAADPDGRVRADASGRIVRGLYVGDGSVVPTGIGVNPMITIMTLARKTSRTVLAEG